MIKDEIYEYCKQGITAAELDKKLPYSKRQIENALHHMALHKRLSVKREGRLLIYYVSEATNNYSAHDPFGLAHER